MDARSLGCERWTRWWTRVDQLRTFRKQQAFHFKSAAAASHLHPFSNARRTRHDLD